MIQRTHKGRRIRPAESGRTREEEMGMDVFAIAQARYDADIRRAIGLYGLSRGNPVPWHMLTADEREPYLRTVFAEALAAAQPAGDLTGTDRGSLAWIEWWMSHHERDGGLGGTLTAALAGLRDMMERFGIPGIPMDRAQPAADPADDPGAGLATAKRRTRPRAYAGARIETRDGRCGTILSAFAGSDGAWFVAFDARRDLQETEPEPAWVKRRDFYLLGEEARPW